MYKRNVSAGGIFFIKRSGWVWGKEENWKACHQWEAHQFSMQWSCALEAASKWNQLCLSWFLLKTHSFNVHCRHVSASSLNLSFSDRILGSALGCGCLLRSIFWLWMSWMLEWRWWRSLFIGQLYLIYGVFPVLCTCFTVLLRPALLTNLLTVKSSCCFLVPANSK